MNYEQKYKNALETVQEILSSGLDAIRIKTLKFRLQSVFPELKESDDEKMKKAIMHILYENYTDAAVIEGVEIAEIVTWLEKQNKQSYSNIPSRKTILAIWELGNDWKELTNGSISTEYGTQLDYIQKHWYESEYYLKEKQGKQTQLDYEHADIPQKDFVPIEPKFKVGDWFVNNKRKDVFLIKSINTSRYCTLEDIKGNIISPCLSPCESDSHLWTIQDAKDGDVLINWNNTTFIFKAIEDETVKFHVAYNEKWDTIKTPSTKLSHLGLPEPQFEFHPATKEQCNLLFSKMKEAGYEWDREKKELKKIEVASKESEDEQMIERLKSCVYASDLITKGRNELIAWLEKQGENKKLDADKVIAWLVANICDFEYYVKLFKKDFGL